MNKIVCELCGSNDVVKQDGFYICQHCGTKYTIEEAKKLIGTVKIDKQEENENLLILARRARNQGNVENAEKYYGLLQQNDPNNWEASFFQIYYQGMNSNLLNLSTAIQNLATGAASTIELLSKSDDINKSANVATIVSYVADFAFSAVGISKNHYDKFREVDGSFAEYSDRGIRAYALLDFIEKAIKQHMPDEKENIKNVQLNMVKFLNEYPALFKTDYRAQELARLFAEIKQQDPSYEAPLVTPSRGGCYIATAVYGSYDCPEVWTLRRYRDYILAKNYFGRIFIRVYYATSPSVVKLFGKTAWFNYFWRKVLDKKVTDLQEKGLSSRPYLDEKI